MDQIRALSRLSRAGTVEAAMREVAILRDAGADPLRLHELAFALQNTKRDLVQWIELARKMRILKDLTTPASDYCIPTQYNKRYACDPRVVDKNGFVSSILAFVKSGDTSMNLKEPVSSNEVALALGPLKKILELGTTRRLLFNGLVVEKDESPMNLEGTHKTKQNAFCGVVYRDLTNNTDFLLYLAAGQLFWAQASSFQTKHMLRDSGVEAILKTPDPKKLSDIATDDDRFTALKQYYA